MKLKILLSESPNELGDSFSACYSDTGDSEEEVDSTVETTLGMINPTSLGRIRTLKAWITDFLQTGVTAGIY